MRYPQNVYGQGKTMLTPTKTEKGHNAVQSCVEGNVATHHGRVKELNIINNTTSPEINATSLYGH